MALITLPYNWTPRPYQLEVFKALDGGIKRVITVWHRRSGKDNAAFNYLVKAAHQRVGNYWHLFPTQRQARRALWDGVDNDGRRIIDQAAPHVLRDTTRNDEMFIRFKNGSTIQINGADQFDALVGSNPVGVVFSEYALTSPSTWLYIAPILAANGGWVWFNSTPRGRNHLFDLYEQNKNNPAWFVSLKTVDDTAVVPMAIIEADRLAGMPEEVIRQEYWCSFNAPNVGAVYRHQLEVVRREKRITQVPHDARFPVECWWDIGHRDATAIWFVQRIGSKLHLIEYYENRGQGLPHYANEISRRPYSYSRHVGPHDLEAKVWAVDARTIDVARVNFGLNFVTAPKVPLSDGIDAVRNMLSRCYFDEAKCIDGIKALEAYQYEWDEDRRIYAGTPRHDWSSHGSDAFRYGAVTPEGVGMIPDWAKQELSALGGKHSPSDFDNYDPLRHWRARRR